MRERERHHDDIRGPQPSAPAVDSGAVREAAERLLAQGTDAIDRALSGNSAAFLAANRQEGGQ
ncbi:MAG: hypothetical protein ABSA52_13340 [Candidatus Binatia bacterium]|jgi:hypothetical protein